MRPCSDALLPFPLRAFAYRDESLGFTLEIERFYRKKPVRVFPWSFIMSVNVRIPTPLRTLTNGQEAVAVAGTTVGEVIDNLETAHPGIKERLVDDKGVRRFVNLYLGDEDIRFLDGLQTAVKAGDELSIVPAIAGG